MANRLYVSFSDLCLDNLCHSDGLSAACLALTMPVR